MHLDRRWRWCRAAEVLAAAICAATALVGVAAAQGRSPTAGPVVDNGRGTGAGRQAAGSFVPVRTDRCPDGAATCDRVVRALPSRPFPTLLARGVVLRELAASPAASLVVLVCPCGRPCLDLNTFGWTERNLGWRGPSGAAGTDVPINFHLAKGINQLFMSMERLDFRVKWSRAIDGSGQFVLSQDITSYGQTAAPAPSASTCRE
jgi:hypothetical protein